MASLSLCLYTAAAVSTAVPAYNGDRREQYLAKSTQVKTEIVGFGLHHSIIHILDDYAAQKGRDATTQGPHGTLTPASPPLGTTRAAARAQCLPVQKRHTTRRHGDAPRT